MQIWRAAAVLIVATHALGKFAIPVPDPSQDASTEAAWVDPTTEAASPPTKSATTDTEAEKKKYNERYLTTSNSVKYFAPGSHAAVQCRMGEREARWPLHHHLRPGARGPWGISIEPGWMLFVLTWEWGWCDILVRLKHCRRRTF